MLNKSEYEQTIIEIRALLDREHNIYKDKIQKILFQFAPTLAKMSEQQIHDLTFIHLESRVTENQLQRARLYGMKLLPEHIAKEEAWIKGMPNPFCYTKMPKESRELLANPNNRIPIQEHNAIIDVPVLELTEERVRKIYKPHEPEEGVLPPDRQNEQRQYEPQYAQLVGTPTIVDENVILSFKYGRSIFKAKVPLQELTKIIENTTSKHDAA